MVRCQTQSLQLVRRGGGRTVGGDIELAGVRTGGLQCFEGAFLTQFLDRIVEGQQVGFEGFNTPFGCFKGRSAIRKFHQGIALHADDRVHNLVDIQSGCQTDTGTDA